MAEYKDITKYAPLRKAVNMAAMDAHKDLGIVERQYMHWGVRGLEKLSEESMISGKRYALLNVNPATNTAMLPCDFKEDLFVGWINDCGEKFPFRVNPKLINEVNLEEIECEETCAAKCDCCFPKQLCTDLSTTQEIKKIDIGGELYDKTITSTLMENGEYYVVTTTPFYNTVTEAVEYRDTKEFVTKFDLEECGCMKATTENTTKLKTYCYDCYCCYCTSCNKDCDYEGGYRIFTESGIIKFDTGMKLSKAYLEWRGSVPRVNGEYVIPEIALDAVASWILFKDGEYNKSLPLWERRWREERFEKYRGNMDKTLGRMKLSTIIDALMLTPKVGFHTA